MKKLQQIVLAQGVGSNEHCVGSMSIGTEFMHIALFQRAGYLNLVCVNLARHATYAERGVRGLELGTAGLKTIGNHW